MEQVRRFYVDGSHGQIHCRGVFPEVTSRPGIICCHMSPKSSYQYEALLPFLARDRFAVALDYPGYGASDAAPDEPHIQIPDYAQAVWEVIDSVSGESADVYLVGHHTGSMVVIEAASQRPENTLAVVNMSAPIFTTEEQEKLLKEYSPIALDEDGTRFKVMWERVIKYRGPGMTLEMAAESMAENFGGGENYEVGHRAAYSYKEYAQRISELKQPLLIINPNDDCFEQTKRADAFLNNGRRIDCPDWGFGMLTVNALEVAALVNDFIAEVEGKK